MAVSIILASVRRNCRLCRYTAVYLSNTNVPMYVGLGTGSKQTVAALEAVRHDFSLNSAIAVLSAISLRHKTKCKYFSMMLQYTILPINLASLSFESLNYGLSLMLYCWEYFCEIFILVLLPSLWCSLPG